MSTIYARLPVSGHYIGKRLRLAGYARALAGFCILVMVVAVVLYRLGAIEPQALTGVLVLATGAAALTLLASLAGLARVWFQMIEGGGQAFGALVLSSIALTPFGLAAYLAEDNPRANVAYTPAFSTDGIGAVLAASGGARAGGSAAAAIEQLPSVVPGRRYPATAPQTFKAVQTVLADLGWPVGDIVAGDPNAPANAEPGPGDLGVSGSVAIPIPLFREEALAGDADEASIADADQYSIEAVARDPVFALPSDVTVRVVEDGGESFVEMVSRSRSTELDLGQNRRFIERFLADLDAVMSGAGAGGAAG